MNIQQINSTNFQAQRVMSIRRTIPNKATEVIDIFKINKKDDLSFAKLCYYNLNKKLKRNLSPQQKQIREFFKTFINRGNIPNNKENLIAVKNGETVTGGVESTLFAHYFNGTTDKFAGDSLYYAYLNRARAGYSFPPESLRKDYGIEASDVRNDVLMNKIEKKYPEAVFETELPDQNEKYDLSEFLGIKDIETEIIL